jgi:tetratricopeptide (TPR) repeat protein
MDPTNSQLVDHAYDLREQGKFREAYQEFLRAANNTDSILEKAGILLNAVTNLTQIGDFETGRIQLDKARGFLSLLNPINLSTFDRDEFLGVAVGIEVETSEILAAEGNLEEAILHFTQTIEEYEPLLNERKLFDVLDDARMRRAYLWADLGSSEKAKESLEELESRQHTNSTFLFYLGHCCFTTKEFLRAQQLLERAIGLGPTPDIAFQAHCSLGMVFYELGEYESAKVELELGAQSATPRYLKQAQIWKWLEYTCISLGLRADAERYGQLARPS